MRFTEQLRRQTTDLRRQVLEHPFVRGIGDGSLPLESFRFYMCQDYVFLQDYCRVLALAVAKADNLETMGRFAGLLNETLNTEMDLHRGFAARFGISVQELEETQGAPGTRAYTQHLLTTAYGGDLADITASVLPCMWDYSDIGQALAAQDAPSPQPLYDEWIQMYAGPEQQAVAEECPTSWAATRPPPAAPASAGCSKRAAVTNTCSGTWRTGGKPGPFRTCWRGAQRQSPGFTPGCAE